MGPPCSQDPGWWLTQAAAPVPWMQTPGSEAASQASGCKGSPRPAPRTPCLPEGGRVSGVPSIWSGAPETLQVCTERQRLAAGPGPSRQPTGPGSAADAQPLLPHPVPTLRRTLPPPPRIWPGCGLGRTAQAPEAEAKQGPPAPGCVWGGGLRVPGQPGLLCAGPQKGPGTLAHLTSALLPG